MTVVIDVHEPAWVRDCADIVDDIGFDIYIFGENGSFIIERKTFTDLVGSLYKNRLWYQLERIREFADECDGTPVLLIEGNKYARMKARYKRMTLSQYIGLQRAIINMGIYIVESINKDNTKLLISKWDEWTGNSREYIRPATVKKGVRTLDDEVIDMLLAVNGIGSKKVNKLLQKFGNIYSIFNSTVDELRIVVGDVVAEHIRELIYHNVKIKDNDKRKKKKRKRG